jgi:hypothetical protein
MTLPWRQTLIRWTISSALLNVISQSVTSIASPMNYGTRGLLCGALIMALLESARNAKRVSLRSGLQQYHGRRVVSCVRRRLIVRVEKWERFRTLSSATLPDRVFMTSKEIFRLAATIEVLSFLLAVILGVTALLNPYSSFEVVLVFIFGVACGGLGSRLSAMCRERVTEQPRKMSIYPHCN